MPCLEEISRLRLHCEVARPVKNHEKFIDDEVPVGTKNLVSIGFMSKRICSATKNAGAKTLLQIKKDKVTFSI
ncbi:MAG: hypothetical protein ACR2IQ_00160 [Minisyncoccia bacterium]